MSSAVVRVPDRVQEEIQTASRVMGRSAGSILEEAWNRFKDSAEFEAELQEAQEVLTGGNIEEITDLLIERTARSRAQSVKETRSEGSSVAES